MLTGYHLFQKLARMALRAQTTVKEILKFYTTGAIRRSVPQHILQHTEVERSMFVRPFPNAQTGP